MIHLIAVNDLRMVARGWSFRTFLVLYTAALGAASFSLLPRLPLDTAAPATEPALFVARWLLVVSTPWWVSRLMSSERGDALVMSIAHSAERPDRVVLAKLVAAILFALELLLISMPIAVVAYASTRADITEMTRGVIELSVVVLCSILATFHWCIRSEKRLLSWGLATATTVVAAMLNPLLVAGVTVALLFWLPRRARRELIYLSY
jgi:hypothetical protein